MEFYSVFCTVFLLVYVSYASLQCKALYQKRDFNSFASRMPLWSLSSGVYSVCMGASIVLQEIAIAEGSSFPCEIMLAISYGAPVFYVFPYLLRGFKLLVLYNRELKATYGNYVQPSFHLKALSVLIVMTAVTFVLPGVIPGYRDTTKQTCSLFEEWEVCIVQLSPFVVLCGFLALKLRSVNDAFSISLELRRCFSLWLIFGVPYLYLLAVEGGSSSKRRWPGMHCLPLGFLLPSLYYSVCSPVRTAVREEKQQMQQQQQQQQPDPHPPRGCGWMTTKPKQKQRQMKAQRSTTFLNVRVWTMEAVLKSATASDLFLAFARRSLAAELPECWFEIEKFTTLRDTSLKQLFALKEDLVRSHLRPGAAMEINIGYSDMRPMLRDVEGKTEQEFFAIPKWASAFELPRLLVVDLMKKNLLLPFLQSEEYKELQQQQKQHQQQQQQQNELELGRSGSSQDPPALHNAKPSPNAQVKKDAAGVVAPAAAANSTPIVKPNLQRNASVTFEVVQPINKFELEKDESESSSGHRNDGEEEKEGMSLLGLAGKFPNFGIKLLRVGSHKFSRGRQSSRSRSRSSSSSSSSNRALPPHASRVSLEEIMANPQLKAAFKTHAEKSFNLESPVFCERAAEFHARSLGLRAQLHGQARYIVDTFLRPSSPDLVELEEGLHQHIMGVFEEAEEDFSLTPRLELFDVAAEDLIEEMRRRLLAPFIHSKAFLAALEMEGEGGEDRAPPLPAGHRRNKVRPNRKREREREAAETAAVMAGAKAKAEAEAEAKKNTRPKRGGSHSQPGGRRVSTLIPEFVNRLKMAIQLRKDPHQHHAPSEANPNPSMAGVAVPSGQVSVASAASSSVSSAVLPMLQESHEEVVGEVEEGGEEEEVEEVEEIQQLPGGQNDHSRRRSEDEAEEEQEERGDQRSAFAPPQQQSRSCPPAGAGTGGVAIIIGRSGGGGALVVRGSSNNSMGIGGMMGTTPGTTGGMGSSSSVGTVNIGGPQLVSHHPPPHAFPSSS